MRGDGEGGQAERLIQLCPRCRFENTQAFEAAYCRRCGAPMFVGFCAAPDDADPSRPCGDRLLGPFRWHLGKTLRLGPPVTITNLRDGVAT